MRKALIIVHISDLHFGAFDSSELFNELQFEFFDKLEKLPRIDMICVNGDLYDHELSLNSNHVYFSFKFIDKLYSIAKKKNCKFIRFLKGTKSHDHDQLDNIPIDKSLNIKIIRTVQDEILFNDFRILYLPEEYIKDVDDYYKDYFEEDNKYNMICLHGAVDKFLSFNNYNSEIQMESAPVFDSKELLRICNGLISCGHIHNAQKDKRIYYSGSFSRWKHGEEDKKGFFISIHNVKTADFKVLPIENTMAKKYITKNITKLLNKDLTIDEMIKSIDFYKKYFNIYKLKLKVNNLKNSDAISKMKHIYKYYASDKYITIEVKSNNTEDEEVKQILNKQDEYLFDDSPPEEKISKFIHNTQNYEMSSDRINELLVNDITKIINSK